MKIYLIVFSLSLLLNSVGFGSSIASSRLDKLSLATNDTTKTIRGKSLLYKRIAVPDQFLTTKGKLSYGGDIKVGDLTGNGQADLLVYRSAKAPSSGATKPNFMGAFTMDGEILWQKGKGGSQPLRPGPVSLYDINGDGKDEVICFFYNGQTDSSPYSMEGITIEILDGETGDIIKKARPKEVLKSIGRGANWSHQRIVIANLKGGDKPREFVIKLGQHLFALNDNLEVMWSYQSHRYEYQSIPAYIPAVGDVDGDGKDEVYAGYYLLDDDGKELWNKFLGHNMDAVAMHVWDNGKVRAIGSGYGHIMDAEGNVVLALGKQVVPHGQELRVAHFDDKVKGPQMMIRYNGHNPDVMLVDNTGSIIRRFAINSIPNETGMEVIYWNGKNEPALLYNGGMLWRGNGSMFANLGLPDPKGDKKMGWYHCVPANLAGDKREEMLIYNPWDKYVYIFTPAPLDEKVYDGYHPGPRQYNARILD